MRGDIMSFDYKRLTEFKVNVGEKEKKIRMIAGGIIFAASLFMGSILMLIVGVALIATGYTAVCPAYSAMDKNTL